MRPVLSFVLIAIMSLAVVSAEKQKLPAPKAPSAKAPATKPAKPLAKPQPSTSTKRTIHKHKQAERVTKPHAQAKKHEPMASKHARQLKDRIAAARAKLPQAEQEAGKAHKAAESAAWKVAMLKREIAEGEKDLARVIARDYAKAKEMDAQKAAQAKALQESKKWHDMSQKIIALESQVKDLTAKLNAAAKKPVSAPVKGKKMHSSAARQQPPKKPAVKPAK